MDPDIPPFTLDYVTTEQTTFITIHGDRYINRSVPIRSSVNMSCYYDGTSIFSNRFISTCCNKPLSQSIYPISLSVSQVLSILFNFTFIIKDEVFRLGRNPYEGHLPLTCTYFHHLKKAKWAWTDPFTNKIHQSLPNCMAECKSNPPPSSNSVQTNWTQVSWVNRNMYQACILF